MHGFLEYLDKTAKTTIPLIGILLAILLGVLDQLTGYEISFSIFYLLPISLVSWFSKRRNAVIVSVLSAATWLGADITSGHIYSHPTIPVWNSIMRLGVFLMAAFLLSAIKTLLEREKTFARADSLTGIANSRAFYEIAKLEIDRSARFGRPFTIAYIDIDNFKQVNDMLGHSQGDRLLKSVAESIKQSIRSIDIVSRLGGDEFGVFLPETNEGNAKTALNKVQKHLLDTAKINSWPVTFSIGAVTCYKSCTVDELIKEADNLMYSVKKSGKNRVEYKIYETPTTGG